MRRVAVIGAPGTGKSTFARQLAEKLELPIQHLDFYYHQPGENYENERDKWIKKVEGLIAKDKWVIDGNYSSTLKLRAERADFVIFLDYPRHVYLRGIYIRRLQYRKKKRVDMPDDWKEHVDFLFAKYVWNFPAKERHKLTDILEKADQSRTKVFKSRKQAAEFLGSL